MIENNPLKKDGEVVPVMVRVAPEVAEWFGWYADKRGYSKSDLFTLMIQREQEESGETPAPKRKKRAKKKTKKK